METLSIHIWTCCLYFGQNAMETQLLIRYTHVQRNRHCEGFTHTFQSSYNLTILLQTHLRVVALTDEWFMLVPEKLLAQVVCAALLWMFALVKLEKLTWRNRVYLLFCLQEAGKVVCVQVVFVVAVGEQEEVQIPAGWHHLIERAELFKSQCPLVVICVSFLHTGTIRAFILVFKSSDWYLMKEFIDNLKSPKFFTKVRWTEPRTWLSTKGLVTSAKQWVTSWSV